MPIFLTIFVILPRQREMQNLILKKIKKRKGATIMTNEMLRKYVGKQCKIYQRSFGTNVTGKILDINENWIEVETTNGTQLINADFVQNIKIK